MDSRGSGIRKQEGNKTFSLALSSAFHFACPDLTGTLKHLPSILTYWWGRGNSHEMII